MVVSGLPDSSVSPVISMSLSRSIPQRTPAGVYSGRAMIAAAEVESTNQSDAAAGGGRIHRLLNGCQMLRGVGMIRWIVWIVMSFDDGLGTGRDREHRQRECCNELRPGFVVHGSPRNSFLRSRPLQGRT